VGSPEKTHAYTFKGIGQFGVPSFLDHVTVALVFVGGARTHSATGVPVASLVHAAGRVPEFFGYIPLTIGGARGGSHPKAQASLLIPSHQLLQHIFQVFSSERHGQSFDTQCVFFAFDHVVIVKLFEQSPETHLGGTNKLLDSFVV